jgi:hypothetical protein
MPVTFEIKRHNDRAYDPPAPWNQWDHYAGCWTCSRCGAAAGFQIHNPGCRAVPHADEDVACPCYGCTVKRTRVGIRGPDRSADPCDPPGACGKDGQCWTHSEWIDEAACDPPDACANRLPCGPHGKVPA